MKGWVYEIRKEKSASVEYMWTRETLQTIVAGYVIWIELI